MKIFLIGLKSLREVVFYFTGDYDLFDEWMRNYAIRRGKTATDAIANKIDSVSTQIPMHR